MAKGLTPQTRANRLTLLRQIDVLTTNGKTLAQAYKEVDTAEQWFCRWRKIYGAIKVD